MKLSECAKVLEAKVAVAAADMDIEISVACGADLMSDVMAFACSSNETMLTEGVSMTDEILRHASDKAVIILATDRLTFQFITGSDAHRLPELADPGWPLELSHFHTGPAASC